MSLRPVAEELERLLGAPVVFADDCVGEPAAAAASVLAPGSVALLENLRFHPGETANDPDFAAGWPPWPRSTSTTPSAPPTAPTLRRSGSPSGSRAAPPAA